MLDAIAAESVLYGVLGRVRAGLPLHDLVGAELDALVTAQQLLPIAHAAVTTESIAINGERVDVVLKSTAREAEWRVVFGSSGTTIDWLAVHTRPARFEGFGGGYAIVINGPSGAGKSTLMQAFQRIATFPIVIFDEPEHVGAVQQEYLIWRDRAPTLHRGYLRAIASLARADNVVAVASGGRSSIDFTEAFGDVPRLSIGLTCERDVLVQRERRTGRWGGIAEASLHVHEGWTYDLTFDTTDSPDPIDHAREVLTRADLLTTDTNEAERH